MKTGCKKQAAFILHVTSLSTFHGQCIYRVGGDGNHCSCWQQTCWVNIDTRQCRNPTRVRSQCCQVLSSHIRDHTHIVSLQALELPRFAASRQENQSFSADRLTFEANSQIIPFGAWFAFWLMCQLISPDSEKEQPDSNWETPFWRLQIKWLFRKSDMVGEPARPLSEGEQVLLYSFPSGQICLWFFFISVCSISGNTRWAWSCGWNNNPVRGRVAGDDSSLTQASGRCHRLHLLYKHMYE